MSNLQKKDSFSNDSSESKSSEKNKFDKEINKNTLCRIGLNLKYSFFVGTEYESNYKYEVFDEKILAKSIFECLADELIKKSQASEMGELDDSLYQEEENFDKHLMGQHIIRPANKKIKDEIESKSHRHKKLEKLIKPLQKCQFEVGIMPICIKGSLVYQELFKTDYFSYLDKYLSLYIVSEGNGPFCREISYSVIRLFAKIILESKDILTRPADILKEAFAEVNKTMNEVYHDDGKSFDCILSGCSVCVVLHISNNLYVGNIGNCGAVILRKLPDKDPYLYHQIRLFVADNPDEIKRIFSQGGEVRYDIKGIPRVYAKGRVYPGIKNTKGLGNRVAQLIGVTEEPDIKIYKMNPKNIDIAIVLGNVEMLDFQNQEELVNILVYCNWNNQEHAYDYIINKIKSNYLEYEADIDDFVGLLIFA